MTGRPDPLSDALDQAIERFARLLRSVAFRYGLSPADEDALVQDVRLRLWKALGSGEKIAVVSASYVYRAATSAALDLIRARRGHRELPLEGVPAGAQLVAPDADGELGRLVREALAALAPDRRLAVRLHLLGYPREEVQALLGWSEARARNLLYRGLADLRARLAELGVTPDTRE
ncbi:MAG: sigma-70 family RNA polymerase sigma factor [Gemmatimonadales bacterium]|nr:sigma-70 family RNA polymerase sigma factor [Gemmatimonadales bacterium]